MLPPGFGPRHQTRSARVAVARILATALLALVCGALGEGRAFAQQPTLELTFVPVRGVQTAIWVERDDGLFMGTLALTYATSTAGIGNRPGALQMNSGYRWPYGRREGVLPIWAHRRAAAPSAMPFRRVIFQNRSSEGAASRTVDDMSVDDYYCLSFDLSKASREALDAVTCASVFSSDKGRYMTEDDAAAGYAEPFEVETGTTLRPLSTTSLYPPRRDVTRCTDDECFDHPDVDDFAGHAASVMPELDAITRATPEGERRTTWSFLIPDDWSTEHRYTLYLEANTEGDYNHYYSPERYPTPLGEDDQLWDFFSKNYGYPYRGQPSLLYALPFGIDADGMAETAAPVGYGALHGEDGELRPIDDTITDDPAAAPGSGADRLHVIGGVRAQLRVTGGNVCDQPDAPPSCGAGCAASASVCGALACDRQTRTCQSPCTMPTATQAVQALRVEPHPDPLRAHMWARLSFQTPPSERPIGEYEVKIRTSSGDWTMAFAPDSTQELLPVALDLCGDDSAPQFNRCTSLPSGTELTAILANLRESTEYEVSVTPRDAQCKQLGVAARARFKTAARTFSTVSPCFIASAAYGSPLAAEIAPLRRFRDRYLLSHAPGRALVSTYYRVGPTLADYVRASPWLTATTRTLISWALSGVRWLD